MMPMVVSSSMPGSIPRVRASRTIAVSDIPATSSTATPSSSRRRRTPRRYSPIAAATHAQPLIPAAAATSRCTTLCHRPGGTNRKGPITSVAATPTSASTPYIASRPSGGLSENSSSSMPKLMRKNRKPNAVHPSDCVTAIAHWRTLRTDGATGAGGAVTVMAPA